jgi:hypothetical protein
MSPLSSHTVALPVKPVHIHLGVPVETCCTPPASSVILDLEWWYDTLNVKTTPRNLKPRGLSQDLDFWVDVSTDWGIGLVLKDRWDAWSLVEGWKGHGCNIRWF